jgi:hypothetical protein
MRTRRVVVACLVGWIVLAVKADAQSLPLVEKVDTQPLLAQVNRLVEALEYLGSPLTDETKGALAKIAPATDEAQAVKAVQEALDPYCLLGVEISPDSRVGVVQGPARPELVEGGWRTFLVKVKNDAGLSTLVLPVASPNARSLFNSPAADVPNRWLDLEMFNSPPMTRALSGLALEYRILQLYSRDAAERRATFSVSFGQSEAREILFNCLPSAGVTLRVLDENGKPATAMFVIRDQQGRLYPSPTKRLAPDFAFHPQVYRTDGETLKLAKGQYTIEYGRGPEYLTRTQSVTLSGGPQTVSFPLERWIDPSLLGWWSGDHHIHAAGCSHYTKPSEGVLPADMIRHCLGEDLKVGCALTWGPGFDYQ